MSLTFSYTTTTTTETYTLSLHDALPISERRPDRSQRGCGQPRPQPGQRVGRDHSQGQVRRPVPTGQRAGRGGVRDRKSTRLNSSHMSISYAVFCLKKKKKNQTQYQPSPS